jgi:hypothetical protein
LDISDVIKVAIANLPAGDHQRSLQAVTTHIDVAITHLQQAQTTQQTHLFTDAIYRCNQAYEGSIKEAYKVLTTQDPTKKSTSQIENYLERNGVLRPRVLDQLRRYRREWRNPATHDHTEDFDESEAFLAIVNIVAFAKVCIDQIGQKFAFDQAQSVAQTADPKIPNDLADLADIICLFAGQFFEEEISNISLNRSSPPEAEISAAFAGFLSLIPDALVEQEFRLGEIGRHSADIYVEYNNDKVIVELQSFFSKNSIKYSINALDKYLSFLPEANGIIIMYDLNAKEYQNYNMGNSQYNKRRLLVSPRNGIFDNLFEKI